MEDEIKGLNWNENSASQKGIKGFVKVADENKKNHVVNVKFTKKQKDFITQYCADNTVKLSDLMRYCLYKYLEERGEDFSAFNGAVPPNQMNMFDALGKD